jgi:hypothetical protein
MSQRRSALLLAGASPGDAGLSLAIKKRIAAISGFVNLATRIFLFAQIPRSCLRHASANSGAHTSGNPEHRGPFWSPGRPSESSEEGQARSMLGDGAHLTADPSGNGLLE